MKSVLISIQPKWCELIASGKKTVEVRKTRPNIDTPFKCYIYETKGKLQRLFQTCYDYEGKGKVIGEFVCDKITMSLVGFNTDGLPSYWDILDGSCLTPNELVCYGEWKPLYGWHISDLVIYDEPKEISEFHKIGYTETKESVSWLTREEENSWQIKRPPQSWCYVEGVEDAKREVAVAKDEVNTYKIRLHDAALTKEEIKDDIILNFKSNLVDAFNSVKGNLSKSIVSKIINETELHPTEKGGVEG